MFVYIFLIALVGYWNMQVFKIKRYIRLNWCKLEVRNSVGGKTLTNDGKVFEKD